MKTGSPINFSLDATRFAAILALVLLSTSESAWAEEGGDRARDLFMQGIEAFQDEDYESALQAFRLSYQLNPVASVLYNLAMCHRALVRYVESIEAFERYLEDGGDRVSVERRQEVEELIRDMLALIGRLRLQVSPADATVEIDDSPVSPTPGGALRVSGGTHTIRVTRDGYAELVRQIDVPIGTVMEMSLELVLSESAPSDSGARRPWYRTWWFWTIVGCAVTAGVGVGLGVGLREDEEVGSGDWDVRLP